MMPSLLSDRLSLLFGFQGESEVATESSRRLIDYVISGGEIGLVILVLSLVAVALVINQLLAIQRSKLLPDDLIAELDPLLRAGQIDRASDVCAEPENSSFLAKVLGQALLRCSRSAFGLLELRSAIEEAVERETARLERATDGIGLIASIAPMLGLLGTVVGMVGAFDSLTVAEGPAKPDALAGNISTALITTVLGLIVAIPATAAYTFLRSRIESLTSEAADVIDDLTSHLEVSRAVADRKATTST